MDITPKHYEQLQIMQIISNHKSQHTLADELSVSVGKINHIVKSLVDKGLVKVGNFISSDDKTKYKYLLTQKGINEKISLTKHFIKIKKAEYEKMQKDLDKYEEIYGDKIKWINSTK